MHISTTGITGTLALQCYECLGEFCKEGSCTATTADVTMQAVCQKTSARDKFGEELKRSV